MWVFIRCLTTWAYQFDVFFYSSKPNTNPSSEKTLINVELPLLWQFQRACGAAISLKFHLLCIPVISHLQRIGNMIFHYLSIYHYYIFQIYIFAHTYTFLLNDNNIYLNDWIYHDDILGGTSIAASLYLNNILEWLKCKSFIWFYHWLVTSFFSIKFSFVFSLLDLQAMQHKSIQRLSSIFSDDCDFFKYGNINKERWIVLVFTLMKVKIMFYFCECVLFHISTIIHFGLIF